MKIALIFPRLNSPSGDPPLGLGYISSYLKKHLKNIKIKIFDATFYKNETLFINKILNFKPDVAGLYLNTIHYNIGIKILNTLKNKKIITICGGPHSTILPDTILDKADFIIKGEGEKKFCSFIRKLQNNETDFENIPGIIFKKNNKLIENKQIDFIDDINELPFPDYEEFDFENYIKEWSYLDSVNVKLKGLNIISSRGCPFSCSYCQPTLKQIFGKKTRIRKAENIVEEMELREKQFNLKNFFFHDDTFTLDKKNVLKFCDLIKEKNYLWGCNSRVDTINEQLVKSMYNAGLRAVHLGIENGNQRILDIVYQKNITLKKIEKAVTIFKKNKIHVMGFFMIGAPTETIEEINTTIKFANKLNIDEATFNIVTPLPGTYLSKFINNDNRYTISKNFSDYNYYSKKIFSDTDNHISTKKIKILQFKALFTFYLNKKRLPYIIKHFLSLAGIKKLFNKINRFF
jgi:radical SAM superfamily enzyme YgiQ (UPF0313 family)